MEILIEFNIDVDLLIFEERFTVTHLFCIYLQKMGLYHELFEIALMTSRYKKIPFVSM